MLHIAICDNEIEQRQIIRGILDDYLDRANTAARVQEFSSGRELLNAMYDNQFDIYLLDVVMPEINGIELGVSIRKKDRNGVIIYLSTSRDFALESFDARAFCYLTKPVDRERFYEVIGEAVAHSKRHSEYIMVKTAEGMERVLLDNILYVELFKRAPYYYMHDETCVEGVSIQTSFQETIAPLLQDKRFFLCGASFVLNLYYIKSINKTGALIADGRRVTVPKRAFSALQNAWSDFWLEGGMRP